MCGESSDRYGLEEEPITGGDQSVVKMFFRQNPLQPPGQENTTSRVLGCNQPHLHPYRLLWGRIDEKTVGYFFSSFDR